MYFGSLLDFGSRSEMSGRLQTDHHEFDVYSGSCATRNRGDLKCQPIAAVESS